MTPLPARKTIGGGGGGIQSRQSTRLSLQPSELGPPSFPPHTQTSVQPPFGPGGKHTHLRKRGLGVPVPTTGQTLWYSKYFVGGGGGGGPVETSNGNASKTKANESFDNGVFFDIEVKRTPSIVSKLFQKRSEHIRQNKKYFRSEANTFDIKKTVFKAKRTCPTIRKLFFKAKQTHQIERKLVSKRSEHIRQKENYFRSEANTLDRKKIIFEAKRTHQIERKLFSKRSEHIRQKESYFQSKANTSISKKIIFEAKRLF